MSSTPASRDTIPRLHQLAPHMSDQLMGLRSQATFEQARLQYISTVARLASEGVGRRTASRVGERDAYWSPTAEVLEEGMRLGFIKRASLPSARRYVDAYRSQSYELTESGREAADLAEQDPVAFFSRVSEAAVRAHPYFRLFLELLNEGPLPCPEIAQGDIEEGRRLGRRTEFYAEWAAERINAGPTGPCITPEEAKGEIIAGLRKRFGEGRTEPPTAKEMAEAMNDAFAVAALKSRGLVIGATDLNVLKTWGSQFRLLDQSRYVPTFRESNAIWLAADLETAGTEINLSRRGLQAHGAQVARVLIAAYRNQAKAAGSNLSAPYLPIYRVRAEAAYACGVTRALTDIVLERLARGEFADLGAQVWLHLGRGDEQPVSEPVYRRGGSRRYEMTLSER